MLEIMIFVSGWFLKSWFFFRSEKTNFASKSNSHELSNSWYFQWWKKSYLNLYGNTCIIYILACYTQANPASPATKSLKSSSFFYFCFWVHCFKINGLKFISRQYLAINSTTKMQTKVILLRDFIMNFFLNMFWLLVWLQILIFCSWNRALM